jgi:5'-nucleotidase
VDRPAGACWPETALKSVGMPYSVEGKLVVAISSRALFDFEEENRDLRRAGRARLHRPAVFALDVPAKEGVAFRLVKKLLAFNRGERSASKW